MSRTKVGVVPVGVVLPPVALAKMVPADMFARPMVPVVVIVPPVTPLLVAMLVTVPVPVTVVQVGLALAPAVVKTCPFVPGARTVHTEPLR